MTTTKITVALKDELLREIDDLVRRHVYPSRAHLIEEALSDKLHRVNGDRLARECSRLYPDIEQEAAEESADWEVDEWPEY